LANVLRSHHIIFVRYRSSGYGVAGIFATTPPDVRQRFRIVVSRPCDHELSVQQRHGGDRRSVPGVAIPRLGLGSSDIQAVFISTTPNGSRSVNILRTVRRPAAVLPFDDGMRFLGESSGPLASRFRHDRCLRRSTDRVKQLGIGLVVERVHVQRSFESRAV
jgi:hypothetical protein